jgi:hypothetical protein
MEISIKMEIVPDIQSLVPIGERKASIPQSGGGKLSDLTILVAKFTMVNSSITYFYLVKLKKNLGCQRSSHI